MSVVLEGDLTRTGTLTDYVGESIHSSAADVDIPSLSAFRLMLAMGASDVSGLLGFHGPKETISMSITSGKVSKTASSVESDDSILGLVLLQERLLSTDKLEEAALQVDRTGRALSRIIFDDKLMPAKDMIAALKIVNERRIDRAISGENLHYTFAHVDVYNGKLLTGPAKVVITQLLGRYLHEALLNYTAEDIVVYIDDVLSYHLIVPENQRPQVRELGFSERELHAIDKLLDGSRTTREILQLSSQALDMTARLLVTLFVFDIVSVVDEHGDPADF